MMKKNKSKSKLEFLTLLTMIIGIVIGSGIFIKNNKDPGHILWFTNGNGYIGIIVWAFMGILCVLAMFSFIEIASSTAKCGNGTLTNWMNKFISRKVGSLVSLFFVFIYMPVIYSFFSMLLVKYIIKINNLDSYLSPFKQEMLYISLGMAFLLFFGLINSMLPNFGKYFQLVDTGIKIIPIFLIMIAACIKHNSDCVLNDHSSWEPTKFLLTTGPVLFSFDGFSYVSNLQKETKNKESLYKALIVGMVIISIIYVLEAFALFYGTKDGDVMSLFTHAFGKKVASVLNWTMILIIFTSINGYTTVGSRYVLVDGSVGLLHTFGKKINLKKSGFVVLIISIGYFIVFNILGYFVHSQGTRPKGEFNPIYYFDQSTNEISIFSFIAYIVLLIGMVVNRFTKKVIVEKKVKIAPFSAILFSVFMSIFISYRIYSIIAAEDINSIILILMMVFSLILFVINEFLMKKYKKISNIDSSVNDSLESKNIKRNTTEYMLKSSPIEELL